MACTPSRGGRAIDLHPIDRDRLADVLDLLLAHRLKTEREFRFNLLRHLAGNADAARVGKLLETGRDVDTVAMPISALHDHFAEVDSNANIDALILAARRRFAPPFLAGYRPRTQPHRRRCRTRPKDHRP